MSRLCARWSSSLSLIASLLFLLAGFAAPAACAQYTAPMDIPLNVNNNNLSSVVSKNGFVAGTGVQNGNGCIFIWQSGTPTIFGCEQAFFGIISYYTIGGVNNSGTIVGFNATGSVLFTATASGNIVPIPVPQQGTDSYSGDSIQVQGIFSSAAIDDNGNVVGTVNVYDSTSGSTYNEAVLYPAGGGTPVFLGPFTATAINDAGQVMGYDQNNQNLWVWTQTGGAAVNEGNLGQGNIYPSAQNDSGQITGTLPNGDPFVWNSGTITDIGTCSICVNFAGYGGYGNSPVINDSGEIAYNYLSGNPMAGTFPAPFIRTSGAFQLLGSLNGSGGTSGGPADNPYAINIPGQIVGTGLFPNGGQQAEYWAPNNLATPLALGAGQINAISDTGIAVGVDYMTGNAAIWGLSGQIIGVSGAPSISVSFVTNNATFYQGEGAMVFFSCSSPDGISSCSAQDSQGNTYPGDQGVFSSLLDTNVVGNFTMTYTAISDAGVTATQTVNYSVVSTATQVTGAKMRGYGALAADQQGDLYRFTMDVEDTQQGTQAGRFDLWSVDKNGFPRVAAIFDADSITSVNFTNTGLLGTNKKGQLLADTVTFQATGEYNDQPGYTITVTATDAGNPGVGVDSMNIAVTDPNNNVVLSTSGLLDAGNIFSTRLGKMPPPVFTDGPPPVTQLEATGPSGAVATWDAPVAVDYNGNTIAHATCSPASGTTFPLGITHGTCTATDSNGRTSAIRFRVNVKDTTPPTLVNMPQNITVPATAANGAVVTYTLPTATDLVDPNPTVTCAKPSGATFAITTTTVTCTAKDASGNKSQATFTVTVTDTIPPKITIASPSGSYSLNQVVTASYACTDAQSGVATCSGPVANGTAIDTSTAGSYSFTVTSTDNAGNTTTKTSTYTVKKK